MHPAPSVIVFTVLSGLGFGFLACLAAGFATVSGGIAFVTWGLGYALAVGGLAASTFHLGNPQRALLAFTQWRTSWLSREAWSSVVALACFAPLALGDWLGFGVPGSLRLVAAMLGIVAVVCTSMIYAQIRAVPRWHHWTVPPLFVLFALAGGILLSLRGPWAGLALALLGVAQVVAFGLGDRRFAARGATLGTATGLGRIGPTTVFEQPHTGGNYLLREMIFVVARRHAQRLRIIAVVAASVVPMLLAFSGSTVAHVVAVPVHLLGAVVARWLFFAEAEHVVGLYYGRR